MGVRHDGENKKINCGIVIGSAGSGCVVYPCIYAHTGAGRCKGLSAAGVWRRAA